MKAIKNILVPTNLTLSSLNVIQYALHQFQGYAFNITLLNVLPLPDSISDLLLLSRKEDVEVPNDFNAAINRLINLFPIRIENINVEHQYGLSVSILNQIIEHKKIDLILFSKPSFTFNSNQKGEVWKILDESEHPVVYIPEIITNKTPRKISFVLDENASNVELLEEMLQQLHIDLQTEVKLVSAAPIDKAVNIISKFKNCTKGGKLYGKYKFSLHFLQGESYEESIVDFTQQYDVDMVFLLKKKNFLKKYSINKHILHQTLEKSKVPLFTIG
ncbi:hypothetical protein [Pedobacter alpinus]|uniref:Universal stress protein family protein n=1 Tax=Pedobacter alpinus TaxID=1590643 RepID=A0ABW5TRF1_9SPHI